MHHRLCAGAVTGCPTGSSCVLDSNNDHVCCALPAHRFPAYLSQQPLLCCGTPEANLDHFRLLAIAVADMCRRACVLVGAMPDTCEDRILMVGTPLTRPAIMRRRVTVRLSGYKRPDPSHLLRGGNTLRERPPPQRG